MDVDVRPPTLVGAKAAAEPARARRATHFIFDIDFYWDKIITSLYLQIEGKAKTKNKR
jgi:hypothetical protein